MDFYREENLSAISQAELVVGIPSWREESTIAHVAEQAALGLLQFAYSGVIINSDNCSDDNTKANFLGANTHGVAKIYLSTAPTVRGKGSNVRNILAKAQQLQAKAVVLVDADVLSLRPLWIKNLLDPALAGHDLVTPLYANEGALLSNLALYPMLRCILGRRVRQPAGGERALSARLLNLLLAQPWDEQALAAGCDLMSSVTAIAQGLPLCQAYVGNAKVQQGDSSSGLQASFVASMRALFIYMAAQANWRQVRWSRPTAIYGLDQSQPKKPAPSHLDSQLLAKEFQARITLSRDFFLHFQDTAALLSQPLPQPDELLWAQMLLAAFKLYCQQPQLLEQIINALEPLFLGRMLHFIEQTNAMNSRQLGEYIENQCLLFEEQKPVYA